MKVAFVNIPIVGHIRRGSGVYAQNLFKSLSTNREVEVSPVNLKDNLKRFDLIHFPYFDPFFLTLPVFRDYKSVVTVHDLIPLKFPKHFPRGLKGEIKWLLQKFSLTHSSAILTDSQASMKDIVNFTGMSQEKIHVAYLGVREDFKVLKSQKVLDEVRKKYNLPEKFILNVGDVNYNKNIPGIINAFAKVRENYPDIDLVLVGNGFTTDSPQLSEVLKLIAQFGLETKVKRLGYIDLSNLVAVYNLAKVYIQPSFAEGFGLPVLEAMACGCPTVVSNTSSLPELVGDGGILVNPDDINNIVSGISEVLQNKSLQQEIITKGIQRAKEFSWNKCAEQTIKIYKEVLG